MKKTLYIILLAFTTLFITACDELTTNNPDPVATKGSMYITSSPSGAQIWVDAVNSNKVTPDSVLNLDAKTYNVTLKLANHYDTTFTVTVTAGQKATKFVTMTEIPPLVTETFSNIKLFERASSSFSGLVLATGTRQSSSAATTDLYYEGVVSGSFVIRSQSEHPSNPATKRLTDFYVGASSNLNDGVLSPIYSSSNTNWTKSMSFATSVTFPSIYNFIYDHDLHYSKFRISASGQDGPFDRWVEVSYIYNKTARDNRF